MSDPKQMEAAVHSYFEGFRRQNVEIIIALFADDATVEDPVGSPPSKGREAIRAFYTKSIGTGAVLEPQGATRHRWRLCRLRLQCLGAGHGACRGHRYISLQRGRKNRRDASVFLAPLM